MKEPNVARRGTRSKRQLQRLRRDAGYRCAKDFAEAINVPYSTYSRYERADEGPNCGIPLSIAWAIADKLNVSIDEIVGRRPLEDFEIPDDDVARRIDRLSDLSRGMLLDYLDYLEARVR